MSAFLDLLDEMDDLRKSYGKGGDKKIRDMSDRDEDDEYDEDEDEDEDEEDEEDEDERPRGKRMGKSFTIALDDGSEIIAEDGSELVKSLIARLDDNESQVFAVLQKSFEMIKSQGEMIKSLQATVDRLGNDRRERKSKLTLAERTNSLMKSMGGDSQELSKGEILAKCLTAQKEGRLTPFEVSKVNIALNEGLGVPADVARKLG